MEGEIWANIKDLGNHKVRHKLGLIPEFPKCVGNDLCESNMELFSLVAT